MTLRFPLGLALLVTSFSFTQPSTAQAAVANCMTPDGACEVSNDGVDSVFCECADGSAGGGGGFMEWAGLSEMDLQPICVEQIAIFCGPPMFDGIPCSSPSGSITAR